MSPVTLVTGGCRSGKSSFALKQALLLPRPRFFIATAAPFDDEMVKRIKNHQQERGESFVTIEEQMSLAPVLQSLSRQQAAAVIVIDCLTVWLGNLYHHYENDETVIRQQIDLTAECLERLETPAFVVTNEVGAGIIPQTELGRQYRDMAGYMNCRMAVSAAHLILCVCGVATKIK